MNENQAEGIRAMFEIQNRKIGELEGRVEALEALLEKKETSPIEIHLHDMTAGEVVEVLNRAKEAV